MTQAAFVGTPDDIVPEELRAAPAESDEAAREVALIAPLLEEGEARRPHAAPRPRRTTAAT